MGQRRDWRCAVGVALALCIAAVILAAFSLMSRVGREELYLADSAQQRFGWRYELLVGDRVQAYEPAFAEGVRVPELPEGTRAVRITRTLAEEIPDPELEWHSYQDGVEAFLDGELLHSDFRGEIERGEDGFLALTAEDWEKLHREQGDVWRKTRMSLPADYLGRELSVVTYFPEDWGIPVPEYPYLGNEESYIANYIVPSVKNDVTMTAYALLTLLIAAMYVVDIRNDGADAKTLLLSLYFLLLFLSAANNSYAGYFSELNARMNLSLLNELYVAPLYLYVALRLRKRRWSYPLCAAIAVWALWTGIQWCVTMRREPEGSAASMGPWALAVFLAVAVAACVDGIVRARSTRRSRRRLAAYGLAFAVIMVVYLFNRFQAWGGAGKYLVNGIWSSLKAGNFGTVEKLVTDVVSAMAVIVVATEFVRRTLRTRQEMSVLQDRAVQTMESYRRLLTVQDGTNMLRHEMRHHMLALSGMLNGGDVSRAKRYVDAVAGDLDRLPTGRYSGNLLVDVIAGSYLDRAWTQGIRVEHRLNVPEELKIADEDMSVFLSNMLQNALEACERMEEGADRYIRLEMRLRGSFLFFKCANSAPEESGERRERPGHGYGLAAMRRVAEKYNSTLVIEHANGEFSIMSDLCLRER